MSSYLFTVRAMSTDWYNLRQKTYVGQERQHPDERFENWQESTVLI